MTPQCTTDDTLLALVEVWLARNHPGGVLQGLMAATRDAVSAHDLADSLTANDDQSPAGG
jgi:hypothetical protein